MYSYRIKLIFLFFILDYNYKPKQNVWRNEKINN